MARARSGGKGRARSRGRMALDWVVNEDTYGANASISVPANGIGAAPLTFPKFMQYVNIGLPAAFTARGGAAWPDGEKQFVKAVMGEIIIIPSSWAIGTVLSGAIRIVKKPMDTATAGMIADPLYGLQAWEFANERFSWQTVLENRFTDAGMYTQKVRVKATVNQWLEPDESLWVVYESFNSLSIVFLPYLRTLMKADS